VFLECGQPRIDNPKSLNTLKVWSPQLAARPLGFISHRNVIGAYVKGRVYVFIDAANILYSQQTLGWRVDYKKLKEYFEHECTVQGLYFYTGKVGANHKQQAFLQRLKNLGYQVTAKEVKRIRTGRNTYEWKGNLDAELIIDALKNSDKFDTCILLSGDSDFAPLLDELKLQGKRVIIMSSKNHVARELLERGKYINLKKLRDRISFQK
jgi:uncharacterized LabA/DUF88 family protein